MSVSVSKKALSLGIVGAIAAMLITACSPTPQASGWQTTSTDDYVQVCEDKTNNQRVDDSNCDGSFNSMHYAPTYYHYNSMIPSVGTMMLVGYLMSPPRSAMVYRGAVPRTGGYAPSVRPNSGFLKVPDSFVGGPPPIPKAPTSVPLKAATVPPIAKVPTYTRIPAPAYKAPSYNAPAYKAPSYKAPSFKK